MPLSRLPVFQHAKQQQQQQQQTTMTTIGSGTETGKQHSNKNTTTRSGETSEWKHDDPPWDEGHLAATQAGKWTHTNWKKHQDHHHGYA